MNKRHLFLALGFVSFSVSMDSDELEIIESGVHAIAGNIITELRTELGKISKSTNKKDLPAIKTTMLGKLEQLTKQTKTQNESITNLQTQLNNRQNPSLSFQQKHTTELIVGTGITSFIVGCGIWWTSPVIKKEVSIINGVIFHAPYSG